MVKEEAIVVKESRYKAKKDKNMGAWKGKVHLENGKLNSVTGM